MNLCNWMTALPDDLPISEINLPGAHNAAAINTQRRTRWACQGHTITEQLRQGIRLLDIRLKPKPKPGPKSAQKPTPRNPHTPSSPSSLRNPPNPPSPSGPFPPPNPRSPLNPLSQVNPASPPREFEFATCHGRRGLPGHNEFQPFSEVQQECNKFLEENPGETIIMTIQIDDWRRTRKKDRPQVLEALKAQLSQSPIYAKSHLPTLKECRGRIYLINRINDDPALGVPINIPDNTPGTTIPATTERNYAVYVQDQYKHLDRRNPEAQKLRLTLEAAAHKKPGTVLLNFASATKPIARFVYIMHELLNHFGQPPAPTTSRQNPTAQMQPGWLLLDYATTTDLPTAIIASNYTRAGDDTGIKFK